MECGTQATLLQCLFLFPLKKLTRANIVSGLVHAGKIYGKKICFHFLLQRTGGIKVHAVLVKWHNYVHF